MAHAPSRAGGGGAERGGRVDAAAGFHHAGVGAAEDQLAGVDAGKAARREAGGGGDDPDGRRAGGLLAPELPRVRAEGHAPLAPERLFRRRQVDGRDGGEDVHLTRLRSAGRAGRGRDRPWACRLSDWARRSAAGPMAVSASGVMLGDAWCAS